MSETSFNPADWPHNFDFDADTVCQKTFRPFILGELQALKDYDALRPSDHTYIFHEHAERVARNIEKTCLHMGLSKTIGRNMYWAVLPHDIGKRQLPIDIWDSEEKPDSGTKRFRRTHTILGAQKVDEYFGDIYHPFKDLMRDIMLYHHAQMDCGGPLGADAATLPAPVRLAAIVEAYDGWRIWRPHYGERDISPAGVLKRMREEKGAAIFDMDLFAAFEDMKLTEETS